MKLVTTFAAVVVVSALSHVPARAATLSEMDRVTLQAAMVQHIDRQVVDGVYPWLDLKTGRLANYAPNKSHPMIVRMGELFVLCADFKDMSGADTNVDFYLAHKGKQYVVVRTEIANRAPLMDLIKAGRAEPAD